MSTTETPDLRATTRKQLVNQTSEQLYSKLKNEKLMGLSKEIAIEILTERKEKGKFDEDLSIFQNGKKVEKVKIEKVIEEKTEKMENTKIEKTEKIEKVKVERIPSKLVSAFPDFNLEFKKGDKVKFTPFRSDIEVTGEVILSYPWKAKLGEVREDLRIKTSEKVYVKKASECTRIK